MYYFAPTSPFYSNFTLSLQLYPFTPTLPFYPKMYVGIGTTLPFYSNFTLLLQLYSLAIQRPAKNN